MTSKTRTTCSKGKKEDGWTLKWTVNSSNGMGLCTWMACDLFLSVWDHGKWIGHMSRRIRRCILYYELFSMVHRWKECILKEGPSETDAWGKPTQKGPKLGNQPCNVLAVTVQNHHTIMLTISQSRFGPQPLNPPPPAPNKTHLFFHFFGSSHVSSLFSPLLVMILSLNAKQRGRSFGNDLRAGEGTWNISNLF